MAASTSLGKSVEVAKRAVILATQLEKIIDEIQSLKLDKDSSYADFALIDALPQQWTTYPPIDHVVDANAMITFLDNVSGSIFSAGVMNDIKRISRV
jgi:hypothetical protein